MKEGDIYVHEGKKYHVVSENAKIGDIIFVVNHLSDKGRGVHKIKDIEERGRQLRFENKRGTSVNRFERVGEIHSTETYFVLKPIVRSVKDKFIILENAIFKKENRDAEIGDKIIVQHHAWEACNGMREVTGFEKSVSGTEIINFEVGSSKKTFGTPRDRFKGGQKLGKEVERYIVVKPLRKMKLG